jgi:hypothetical protein
MKFLQQMWPRAYRVGRMLRQELHPRLVAMLRIQSGEFIVRG